MVTQNILTQERKSKIRWFVAVSTLPLLGVVTAFGVMPQSLTQFAPAQVTSAEIAIPSAEPTSAPAATFWRTEKMSRSDTVDDLLAKLNISDQAASTFLRKSAQAADFRKYAPGKQVMAESTLDGELIALRFTGNAGAQVSITRHDESFMVQTQPAQVEQRVFLRTGVVKSSLFAATDEADLPDVIASQLSDIFGGDIDFHRDLAKGDKFSVIYDMTYSNGQPVRTGRILAAEFINQGTPYRAVYFKTDATHGDYYTPEGKSVHKAFLRSPLEFSRVSSGFSSARMHPVLNRVRAHKGVDYAAPTGTKVKSTADGVVAFSGKMNGFGNVVEIAHQGRYRTVYGHLSRFASGMHKGQAVHQGDIIGYVGMTGLASAPHLHYEFKIDGVQRDPLRVAMPDAKPISAGQKAAFEQSNQALYARLGLMRDINLAKLD
ncbi:M23 family metallopeptidase [Ferriphaselus sp. R-1]|uniref:M23 family metallopeptidase n=1 Tax=Ferriphaselus sp. R-1 TaxID=1485544 RepID=UPI0005577AED|nr:M23 family metallopeptidase [Ferriphaselus sp. R-1]